MATRRPNAAYLKKPPSAVHEGFAEFIAKTTGVTVEAKVVGLVQRLYPLYLKRPAVQKAKEAERAEREAEARRKAEEKAARLRERLAKIEADRLRVLKELGVEDAEDTPEDDGEEPEPEEEPAPIKRARARKAAAKQEPQAEVIEAADRFTTEDDDESADEVDLTDTSEDDLFEDDENDEEDW
jgi:hypothetical protein